MAYSGKFTPKNPEKYVGNPNNIIWRSTWERRVMNWFDTNDSIISWSSEEFHVKYFNPIDNKTHRYFPDFIVKMKDKNNKITVYMIEVKPEYQTKPPTQKRKTKRYLEEQKTYIINQSKWKAAEIFCHDQGWVFKIITEKDLGIK